MHKKEELKYIIAFFSSFLFFGFFALPALAQDAIQCKPPADASSGVNLNSNLRLINTTDDTLNDIYLGTGEIYFDSNFSGPYATKSGGDLFLYSPAAILFQSANDTTIQSGGNILFKDGGGGSLGGIYPNIGAAPGAANSNRALIADGKIEGWQVNGRNELCAQGTCVTSWSGVNIAAYGESRCDGVNSGALGACANVVATNDVRGARLCLQGSCIDGWDDVMSSVSNMFNTTGNMFEIKNGGNFVMGSGSTYRVCDDLNGDGNYDANNTPPDDLDDPGECRGTGRGVSKIIAGSGISVMPASGDGDVTISSKIIWCDGACPAW